MRKFITIIPLFLVLTLISAIGYAAYQEIFIQLIPSPYGDINHSTNYTAINKTMNLTWRLPYSIDYANNTTINKTRSKSIDLSHSKYDNPSPLDDINGTVNSSLNITWLESNCASMSEWEVVLDFNWINYNCDNKTRFQPKHAFRSIGIGNGSAYPYFNLPDEYLAIQACYVHSPNECTTLLNGEVFTFSGFRYWYYRVVINPSNDGKFDSFFITWNNTYKKP